MAGGEGGNRLPEPLKIIARVAIDAMKSIVALFKKLSELIASAVGVNQYVKAVMAIFYGLIIAMLLALILTLRSCVGDTDEVASTSTTEQIATTTEPSTSTTTSTTTTVPQPSTTTSVPILNPVTQGGQTEKATTTTEKEPTRKTKPKTTVAPTTSTTIAPTTTVEATVVETAPPTTASTTTTSTTIAGRVVTFDFQATMSAADRASTIPAGDITAVISVDTRVSTAVLPDGATSFSFKLYRFTNMDERGVMYVPNSTNATCTDGGSQNDLGHGIMAGYYRVVTCTATGSGPISLPIIWEGPP
jgi:hypothetical protein